MGSRVRENPKRLFEFFAEVAKPDNQTDAFILQSYPPDFQEEDVINNVTKFAFPCQTDGSAVDHFTFVLTDLESMYRFGFCRHATGAQTCLCIISFLPWFEVFYNLLNHLAEILNRPDKKVDALLRAAYVQEIAGAAIPVTIVAQQEMFSFKTPDPGKLPSIPNSRNLTEYYNAVDCNNMMKIFAGMLNERRILITSKKLSRLTACVHGSEALLYPMHWQHLFIPVLPAHLIDYCSAPMPYVIGVHSSIMEKIHRTELGDAVIVDADNNTVETEHDDLELLPTDVVSHLRKVLRSQQSDRIKQSVPLTGDAISKAFLHALIKLIGSYREALDFRDGEPITFNHDEFVNSRPANMHAFLSKMLHLQIFQQFVNERLDMLNTGQGFSDIFEAEASLQGDKLNAQSKYKDWLGNMKKKGKNLQRGSKDAWSDIKKKLGTKGQKAYKGFKNKIGKLNKEEQPSNFKTFSSLKEGGVTRPITRTNRPSTIVGPVLTTSRPQRPPPPRSTSSGSDIGRPTISTDKLVRSQRASRNYHLLTEKSQDDTSLEYNRISINFLADPDIQNVMRKSASMEIVTPSHGISDDSSSSEEQSGATEPNGISELDIANVSVSGQDVSVESSRGSTVTNETYRSLPHEQGQNTSHPIPAPRSKRRQGSGSDTNPPRPPVSDKPLIHLESPEKPLVPSTQFDPLFDEAGPSTSSWTNVSVLDSSPVISAPTRQSSIKRSDAFRSPTNLKSPLTATSSNSSNSGSDLNFFDPLANSSEQLIRDSPDASAHTTSDSGEDLMGSWNLQGIVGTPEKTPPKPPPKTYKGSNYNQRAISEMGSTGSSGLGRGHVHVGGTGVSGIGQIGVSGMVQSRVNNIGLNSSSIGQSGVRTVSHPAGSSIRQPGVSSIRQPGLGSASGFGVDNYRRSGLQTAPARNRNPVYFPSGQPTVTAPHSNILKPLSTDSGKAQQDDPFADLVDLSPAKLKPSPPRSAWQKFDQ